MPLKPFAVARLHATLWGLVARLRAPHCANASDARASDCFDLAAGINNSLLSLRVGAKPIDFAMLDCGYTPIDLDTFVMNNEDTSKDFGGAYCHGLDICQGHTSRADDDEDDC